MNLLDWFRGRHVLPPVLLCVRCSRRLQLSDRIVTDDAGFVHTGCLMAFERSGPLTDVAAARVLAPGPGRQ